MPILSNGGGAGENRTPTIAVQKLLSTIKIRPHIGVFIIDGVRLPSDTVSFAASSDKISTGTYNVRHQREFAFVFRLHYPDPFLR